MRNDFQNEIDLAKRIHPPVETMAALRAIPAKSRVHGLSVLVVENRTTWVYDNDETTAGQVASKFQVPDDIAAQAAYVSDPTSVAGRWVKAEAVPIVAETFTNPLAADADALHSGASSTSPVTLTSFSAGGVAELDKYARPIAITLADTTADAPATATISGYDQNLQAKTVTINLPGTTAWCFRGTGLSISMPAGSGPGATINIGFPGKVGLSYKAAVRSTKPMVVTERLDGAPVATAGTFEDAATVGPNGAYTPNTAFNGTRDYDIAYEQG